MPFDPSKPSDAANVVAAELRGQLNALNDKIDAVPAGPPGADGADGADGAPGEVSAADLVAERINHAANPSGVSVLALSVSDPVTQAQGEAIVAKLNELITALRREP